MAEIKGVPFVDKDGKVSLNTPERGVPFVDEDGKTSWITPEVSLELFDFVIQYLYSEHDVCDPAHAACPYMPEELREMAVKIIAKVVE